MTRITLAFLAAMLTLAAGAQPIAPGREWTDTDVAVEDSIAFALYTAHRGVLKLTAQLYPLADDVGRDAELLVRPRGEAAWRSAARTRVDDSTYGAPQADRRRWLAHFRVEGWDHTRDWDYRVVAADGRAAYEGLVRRDPVDKPVIVVASLSCNSNQDRGPREDIVRNLRAQDPDLLFFAGDQSYDHKLHYEAWLLFGRQFGELMRDRPTVTIPDDHDIGQGNLWGEGGIAAESSAGDSGGYFHSPQYVRSVEAAQTWHLPDPFDPTPVARGIGVYYTALNVGGVDFAILEDRKFKSGPKGLVRAIGPRPDHVNDPGFDPDTLNVPEAVLLGDRQHAFIDAWSRDWTGAAFKVALSQTVFGNAAHRHGPGLWGGTPEVDLRKERGNRLVADLDSNGWPRHGRDRAIIALRKAFATHLCGDQHLATLVHHGVNGWRDGIVSFASPAIVNYYVRWWDPLTEAVDPIEGGLPHLGGYRDAFGNKLTMLGYVNPDPARIITRDERGIHWGPRAEGYALVRFDKRTRDITYEVWPRMVDATAPDARPYDGFPVVLNQMDNYGRRPAGYLPEIVVEGIDQPVFEVIDEPTGETVYTIRTPGPTFRPHVFHLFTTYRVRIAAQPGPEVELTGLTPKREPDDRVERVRLGPAAAATDHAADGYELVWAQEFDRDGAPDPAVWVPEIGFARNREDQWYQPDNAFIENGCLVIEARRERIANPGHEPGSRDWRHARRHADVTSASLTTRGTAEWTYGRFEMRARIDIRPGLWPAWWTVGHARPWPGGGEIDMMEYYRGDILANACWKAPGDRWAQVWDTGRIPLADIAGDESPADWAARFHLWRMDWDENQITLSLDGRVLNTIDVTRTINPDGTNPFREPHHMIVNLAVGGTNGGEYDDASFPARYEIDFIRVYQRTERP